MYRLLIKKQYNRNVRYQPQRLNKSLGMMIIVTELTFPELNFETKAKVDFPPACITAKMSEL